MSSSVAIPVYLSIVFDSVSSLSPEVTVFSLTWAFAVSSSATPVFIPKLLQHFLHRVAKEFFNKCRRDRLQRLPDSLGIVPMALSDEGCLAFWFLWTVVSKELLWTTQRRLTYGFQIWRAHIHLFCVTTLTSAKFVQEPYNQVMKNSQETHVLRKLTV